MNGRFMRAAVCALLVLVGVVCLNIGPARAGDPADDLVNPPPGSGTTVNGPVAIAPTVYLDFWLPTTPDPRTGAPWQFDHPGGNSDFKQTMKTFISDLGGNPLFNVITQYPGTSRQPDPVNALHYGGSFTDTTDLPLDPASNAAIVRSADITDSVTRARDAFGDPTNSSSIFVLLVPYGVYY